MKYLSFLLLLVPAIAFGQKKTGLDNFFWLQGKWQSLKDHHQYEEWSLKNEKTLAGSGYSITESDSVNVSEVLRIFSKNNLLYYGADIAGPQEEVVFLLSSAGNNSFSFTNREHDFPQVITYTRKGKKKMVVTISGPGADGQTKTIEFSFRKVK